MKYFTKKTLAIAVAIAIVLTSISIAVFADPTGTLTTYTNFSRLDADGNWVSLKEGTSYQSSDILESAKPGDYIKADLYLTSTFLVGNCRLIMAYDDILTIDTTRSTETTAGSGQYNIDSQVGIKGTFKDGQVTADSLVKKDVVTTADTAGKKFYDIRTNMYNKIQQYDNTLAMTFYFKVSDTATVKSTAKFEVFPNTTMTPDNYDYPSEADMVTDDTFDGKTVRDLDDEYLTAADYNLTINGSDVYSETLSFEGKATFSANGDDAAFTDGKKTVDATGVYGAAAAKPADPTREHYTFKGWATSATATKDDVVKTFELGVVDDEVDYYAVWEIDQFEIKFVDDDGTVIKVDGKDSQMVDYNKMPTVPANPTKAEDVAETYTFKEWSPAVAVATQNQTYTATYNSSPREYEITFIDSDGNQIGEPIKFKYGTSAADVEKAAPTATKTATEAETFTFTGWSPSIVSVTQNATYTAQFSSKAVDYTVTFNNDDDTLITSGPVAYGTVPTFTGETPEAKVTETGKDYTFAGWKDTSGTKYPTGTDLPKVTGNATYTAYFTDAATKYTVTFKNDDGTELASDKYDYNTVPAYIGTTPTKTSTDPSITYEFKGWNDGTTSYGKDDVLPAVTDNVTYTAEYDTIVEYTITFDTDGGSSVDPIKGVEGSTVTAPADPTKAGYVFAGWEPEIPATMPGENITIKAKWDKEPATVTDTFEYIVVDDSGVENVVGTPKTETGKENTTYTVPEISVPDGYETTETEWTTADGTAATGTFGTENAIYRVKITPKKYTLTVKDSDGNVIDTQEVTYGSEIPEVTSDKIPAEKEGPDGTTLVFKGWDSDPAGYEPGMKMPSSPVTLTPRYETKQSQYVAKFYKDADKTQLYTVEDVKTGEIIPDPGTPTKFGYVFAGWENADGYTVGGQMPAEDVDFTAKWELDKTMIAIVVGGVVIGGGIAGTVAAVNTALITGAAIVGGVAVIGGAIYLAKNTHTVTYYVDGQVYKTFYIIEGTKVIVPSDPTKEGYTFAGWDNEIPATMPDHDLSFNATWTAGQHAAAVDGNIPATGSAAAGISALAIIASATAAAYVITTRKKDED